MRCLVTGASGFLGSWLVRRLLSDGHAVMAMVRPGKEHHRLESIAAQVEFTYADLATVPKISADLERFQPEILFHLAWWGGNSRRYVNDPAAICENIPGTLELVRLAHQANCGTLVFFGSAVEYGRYRIPVRETDLPEPSNLYGLSKYTSMLLTEALCKQWNMRFCGVRPFWTYGPMDDDLRMIPSVIQQLLAGNRPKVTAGEQLWDFLYVEDAVKALILIMEKKDARGIFNLGSGAPRKLKDAVLLIREYIDASLQIGFGEIPYAPDQIMHLEADIDRLRSATGWTPQVSLEEGLRRTVEWYRMKGNHG